MIEMVAKAVLLLACAIFITGLVGVLLQEWYSGRW